MDTNTNKFYSKNMEIIPPRFTINDWYLDNRMKYKNCFDQKQLADRILAESDKQVDLIEEINLLNKREVEHQLEERLKQVEFVKEDIIKQRKEVCIEIDNLTTYNNRIVDAMVNIKDHALVISQKCIILRESRLGIDLCHDDVEIELLKEVKMIESVLSLLKHVLDQCIEQIRRLRSDNYFFDRDLEDKDGEINIEKKNLLWNEHSTNLSIFHGFAPLDPANVTLEEWAEFSNKKIKKSAEELNSSRLLRAYVSTLLKQVTEDLILQCNTVNDAFRRRIEETKEAKSKLEFNHGEISKQVNEMTSKIIKMEKTVSENERFMALSHTRMGNRCQRPRMELVKDFVEAHLVNEVHTLRENCFLLQQNLLEAQASLRYLLKTQIQLEEDINVKTNTLKIDEVECMTLRQSLEYHHY